MWSYYKSGLTHTRAPSTQLRVPTDTLRHRVQAYLHPNVGAAARTIAAKEGPRGLFRGFGPTIMRDVPEIALQFVVYDRYGGHA